MEKEVVEIVKSYYGMEKLESVKILGKKLIVTILGAMIDDFDEEIKSKIFNLGVFDKISIVHTAEKPIETKSSNPFDDKWDVKGVKRIIGVASGKGGVGKSTTSVNLALALANQGLKVALFDADIYGPSVPTMLGYEGEGVTSFDGKILEPFMNMSIKSMSIGALVEKDTPLIWRGSKAVGAIEQLMTTTNWGDIDVMIIDMPPGTGDIQLSLCQKIKLDGIVVVSTPQDIALIDAVKAVKMFGKVGVPILGVIENMSYYVCENCGTRANIFGHEGAKKTAEKLGIDFLGEIPLHLEIRENADLGTPIVFANPDSSHTKAYEEIAKKLVVKL